MEKDSIMLIEISQQDAKKIAQMLPLCSIQGTVAQMPIIIQEVSRLRQLLLEPFEIKNEEKKDAIQIQSPAA